MRINFSLKSAGPVEVVVTNSKAVQTAGGPPVGLRAKPSLGSRAGSPETAPIEFFVNTAIFTGLYLRCSACTSARRPVHQSVCQAC
jgi:hypothetical protein